MVNLLEHHVLEIHNERKIYYDEIDKYLYLVDVTHNCHGVVKREELTFFIDEWEKAKDKGYWLG